MRIPLLCVFFSTSLLCFSQEKLIDINSFKIYSGINNVSDPKGIDFVALDPYSSSVNLAPRVQNANGEYKEYAFLPEFPYFNFYVNASFEKLIKKKLSWFCGVNYIRTKRQFEDYSNMTYKSFETEYENGTLVYSKDSVQALERGALMTSNIFSIENAFSFSTNQDKNLSFYGGISTQVGFSITSYDLSVRGDLYIDEVFHDSLVYDFNSDSDQPARNRLFADASSYESNIRCLSAYFSINAIVGTNLLLSNKDREKGKIYLFSEFKPGYAFHYIPKMNGFMKYYNGLYSLVGIRYKF